MIIIEWICFTIVILGSTWLVIRLSRWFEKRKQEQVRSRIINQVKAIKQSRHVNAPYCPPFNSDRFKTVDKEIDDGHKNFDYE